MVPFSRSVGGLRHSILCEVAGYGMDFR